MWSKYKTLVLTFQAGRPAANGNWQTANQNGRSLITFSLSSILVVSSLVISEQGFVMQHGGQAGLAGGEGQMPQMP